VDFQGGLEQINNGSAGLVTWALALVAGSVATIVSTSYLRSMNRVIRCIYLLFIPGWLFLGLSIYYGERISRRFMASKLVPEENLHKIAKMVNQDFANQRLLLEIGLLIFALWLVIFLIWWVFGDWSVSSQSKEGK
jgi:small-conductance mechanosensitive channel